MNSKKSEASSLVPFQKMIPFKLKYLEKNNLKDQLIQFNGFLLFSSPFGLL